MISAFMLIDALEAATSLGDRLIAYDKTSITIKFYGATAKPGHHSIAVCVDTALNTVSMHSPDENPIDITGMYKNVEMTKVRVAAVGAIQRLTGVAPLSQHNASRAILCTPEPEPMREATRFTINCHHVTSDTDTVGQCHPYNTYVTNKSHDALEVLRRLFDNEMSGVNRIVVLDAKHNVQPLSEAYVGQAPQYIDYPESDPWREVAERRLKLVAEISMPLLVLCNEMANHPDFYKIISPDLKKQLNAAVAAAHTEMENARSK